MHSRQKLWLHGVVTRSLYGSRQMEHWRGEVRVGELVGGCARTDGSGATSTGDAVSAAARSRAFSARIRARCSAHQGAGGAAAGDDAAAGGAAAGGAGLGAAAVSPPPPHPIQIVLSKNIAPIGPQ